LRSAKKAASLVGALLMGAAASPTFAQNAGVSVELNKLEAANGACRAYLVLNNATGSAFGTLKLDLVMFDQEGIVAKRLAVETAPLPADKTILKVFDIDSLACAEVGRVLLYDVLSCADDSGARDDCTALITLSSRTDAPFVK